MIWHHLVALRKAEILEFGSVIYARIYFGENYFICNQEFDAGFTCKIDQCSVPSSEESDRPRLILAVQEFPIVISGLRRKKSLWLHLAYVEPQHHA